MKSVRLFDDEDMEVGYEIAAKDIESLSNSLKKLEQTRISRKLIVAIIHDDTKMNKGQIEAVLDSIQYMDKRYLKPKTEKKK